jgi:Tfp pilus assembly protein PilF
MISVTQGLKDQPLENLAACQVRLGQLDQARSTMAQFVEKNPGWTLKNEAAFPFQMSPPLRRVWLHDLQSAGLPEQ